MTEAEVEVILQRARERFPEAAPRIISANGPQFMARDFKEFIRICGMTHVPTSPFDPQSNGKIERRHQSLKGECVRPRVPQLSKYGDSPFHAEPRHVRDTVTLRQFGPERKLPSSSTYPVISPENATIVPPCERPNRLVSLEASARVSEPTAGARSEGRCH